ncbi:helix-turn-helix domain-containing protein [Silvimonas iriomotensis]|uniref:AraC family transcriptional regulator n=1 Tax=Silvimonas iriomotensis TaxID=449662 RepID=A0ABQ2P476_9NEIS|nr:AraC family transcriptional regulator [Silvimonas iriomotensis]GGP17710.1 AraC family transcriptional regulator [Silvimonas iriomotensis]
MNTVVTPPFAVAAGTAVPLQSSEGLGWQGFGAALVGIGQGTHRIAGTAQHRVGIHVGAPVRANCVCDGRRHARIQAHGDADVIPAGVDGVWTDDGDCTILRVWMSDEFVRATSEQLTCHAAPPLRAQLQLRDARLQHLAWALQAELQASEASDPLFAESLCAAMVVRLLGDVPSLQQRRYALTPRTAARVVDYIESHLAERLTLAELAALVDLSVPHFKVLFKTTLGQPVHRYIVQRRVERARDLLLHSALPASQIALDAGFAHQSHMAHWMNRLLGVSPRDLLRTRD